MIKVNLLKPDDRKIPIGFELTKEEVNNLKDFCDENLAVGTVIIIQDGLSTRVQVKDLPETLTDITDRDYL